MSDYRKLINAVQEAALAIHYYPDDSISDIFNEFLKGWEVPLRMNDDFKLDPILGENHD